MKIQKKYTLFVTITAIIGLASTSHAQVNLKPDNASADAASYTYTFADVASATNPTPTSGEANNVAGTFTNGTGSFSVAVSAFNSGWETDGTAGADIDLNPGTYFSGLTSGNVGVSDDDWAAPDVGSSINPGQSILFAFNLSSLTSGELVLNDVVATLSTAGADSVDVVLYDPSTGVNGTIVSEVFNQQLNSISLGGVTVLNGYELYVANSSSSGAPANFFRVDSLNLNVIPEPSSFALLAGFLAISSVLVRRRNRE